LDGLLVALGDIDNVIRIIRGSNDVKEAKFSLSSKYNLSDEQIGAILEMKLQKLVSLEKKKIEDEHDDLKRDIKNLSEILSSEKRQYDIIKEEMGRIKEDYGDERRTEIKEGFEMIVEEDLIPDIDYLVTLTDEDYIKMTPLEIYRIQGRGGRGVAGVKGDVTLKLLSVVNGREKILFFTDKGKVYGIDAYRIPEAGRVSRGRSIVNLLNLDKDEKITSLMSISCKDEDENLVMVTKRGLVKKTSTREFEKIISSGKIAIKLREDDDLVSVKKCNEDDSIFLVTKNGMATRFKEKEVRRTGRNTYGMIGMRFKREDDEVVAMETIGPDDKEILIVTEGGYGKRVSAKNFSLKHRGTHGVKAISRKERVKDVVNVKRGDEIIVGSRGGRYYRNRCFRDI
jgi:Type IIA topoisomerase (DNA gyrase/topo II, topoisomerase IV), A subunit